MNGFIPRLALGAAAAALAALPALGQDGHAGAHAREGARASLDTFEVTLDRAVDRVSLPHAARLMGRAESARAYRLPGYGVVLVLTPRALPGPGRVYFMQRRGPRPGPVRIAKPLPPGAPPPPEPELPEEGVETFERQVLVLQYETEATRRAAEEDLERIVHEVRVRVAPPPPPPPEAPEAPAPPAPPAAPESARAAGPTVTRARQGQEPPRAATWTTPGSPPWKFWLETGSPEDSRTPEVVIADVRGSVIQAITTPGPIFDGMPGDERVTVTVDFVPGGLFAAHATAERTLVVSVRAKDVQAHARGALSRDELARRVEVSEY